MPSTHYSFEAIGTSWEIAIYDNVPNAADLEKEIKERIDVFDKHYSRFRKDSLVSEMARNEGTYDLPEDALPMLETYEKLYQLTDGAVTPLIGQTLADAGYDASYSLQTSETISKPAAWDEIIAYDKNSLTLKKPALLDFGAAGKGYLIDIIGALLKAHHITTYTINAGGDVLHEASAQTTLRVGLEHPNNSQQVIGIVPVYNQSICGSASNKRRWGEYHHIIDPKTAKPINQIIATWVIADSALLADAIATALFFVSPDKLETAYTFTYIVLSDDLSVKTSADFKGELFLKK